MQRWKKMAQTHDLLKRKQEKTLLPPFCFTHISLQDQIGFQSLRMPVSASFFILWAPPPLQSVPRSVNFRNKTVMWKSLLFYNFFAWCDKISLPIYTVPHKQVVKVRCCPAVVPLLSALFTFWTSRHVSNINQWDYHSLNSYIVKKMMFEREYLDADKMDTAHVHLNSSQFCPISIAIRTRNLSFWSLCVQVTQRSVSWGSS